MWHVCNSNVQILYLNNFFIFLAPYELNSKIGTIVPHSNVSTPMITWENTAIITSIYKYSGIVPYWAPMKHFGDSVGELQQPRTLISNLCNTS